MWSGKNQLAFDSHHFSARILFPAIQIVNEKIWQSKALTDVISTQSTWYVVRFRVVIAYFICFFAATLAQWLYTKTKHQPVRLCHKAAMARRGLIYRSSLCLLCVVCTPFKSLIWFKVQINNQPFWLQFLISQCLPISSSAILSIMAAVNYHLCFKVKANAFW